MSPYIFAAITFLIVSGCVSNTTFTPQATRAITPDLTPSAQPTVASVTPGPQLTLGATPTLWWYSPDSTLQPDGKKRMVELLQFRDCKLPCYLGITPGKTTLQEAQAILGSLHTFQEGTIDGSYAYLVNIGDPAITWFPPSYALIYSSTHLTVESPKSIVQSIYTYAVTDSFVLPMAHDTYRKYWSRYSVSGVFAELGKPDQIYAGIDYDKTHNSELIVVYKNLGVFLRFRGLSQDNNLCTIDEKGSIQIDLHLFDPASGIKIEDFNYDLGSRYWPPINEALGIEVDEFYERVLADPSVCFESLLIP